MIDELFQTGEGVCRNCGGRIVRLVGSMIPEHWTHEANERGRYDENCPDSPVAEPVEP